MRHPSLSLPGTTNFYCTGVAREASMRVTKTFCSLNRKQVAAGKSASPARQAAALVQALESRVLLSHGGVAARVKAAPGLSPAITLGTSSWTPIGPAATTTTTLAGGAISGRINAVATDPTNANVYYIGAAAGGVWKTTNAGASWTPLTDTQSTLNTGSIAIAHTAPNTIYVGNRD